MSEPKSKREKSTDLSRRVRRRLEEQLFELFRFGAATLGFSSNFGPLVALALSGARGGGGSSDPGARALRMSDGLIKDRLRMGKRNGIAYGRRARDVLVKMSQLDRDVLFVSYGSIRWPDALARNEVKKLVDGYQRAGWLANLAAVVAILPETLELHAAESKAGPLPAWLVASVGEKEPAYELAPGEMVALPILLARRAQAANERALRAFGEAMKENLVEEPKKRGSGQRRRGKAEYSADPETGIPFLPGGDR